MCSGEVCAFTQGNEARLVSEDVNAASKPLSMEGSEDEWEGKWREPGEAYDKNSEGVEISLMKLHRSSLLMASSRLTLITLPETPCYAL